MRCFPCALDFGQSNNTFYEICTLFKHNFAYLSSEKSIGLVNLIFSYISPLKSLNLVLNLGVKLDGQRDTWQGVQNMSVFYQALDCK